MVMGMYRDYGVVVKGNQMVAINCKEEEILVGDAPAIINEIDRRYGLVHTSTLIEIVICKKPKLLAV